MFDCVVSTLHFALKFCIRESLFLLACNSVASSCDAKLNVKSVILGGIGSMNKCAFRKSPLKKKEDKKGIMIDAYDSNIT